MRLMGPLFVVAALGGVWAYLTILESEAPTISASTQLTYVGSEFTQKIEVGDIGRGVQRIRVWLSSPEREYPLDEQKYDGSLFGGAVVRSPRTLEVKISPKALGVPDGRATLQVEAVDFSLRGNRSALEIPVVIDTRKPIVSVRTGPSALTYVRRGGSELAVYTVDEESPRHGVVVGEHFFPGYPHPSEKGVFMAFYSFSWNHDEPTEARVVADDRAGNEQSVKLVTRLLEQKERADRIELNDEFMRSKIEELGGDENDLVGSFVKINSVMREQNANQLRELCRGSGSERLWSKAFIQMANSDRRASYAEHRTYMYKGKEVDKQVHLGFDFASTSRAPVPASNDGVIAFAGPLGIYGQTVVIDHGMGLFSLYGHLSEITVEKRRPIARGETIGKTGTTGLAGGDHLHFGMLLAGEFVDPIEWFDQKWIDEHLEAKLRRPDEQPSSGAALLPGTAPAAREDASHNER